MPYPYNIDIPELVERAHRRAEAIGFPLMPAGRPIGQPAPTTAITPMDGSLLRCLAAQHPVGTIGEIGTGPGVSTAWLLSGMGAGTRLISCDIDSTLVEGAATFFSAWAQVEVRCGDWRTTMSPSEPFDLLFFDADAQAALSKRETWAEILNLLKPGGTIVMDDLVPVDLWPAEWRGMTDHKREFCLCNPSVAGCEVRTSPATVSIVATKL